MRLRRRFDRERLAQVPPTQQGGGGEPPEAAKPPQDVVRTVLQPHDVTNHDHVIAGAQDDDQDALPVALPEPRVRRAEDGAARRRATGARLAADALHE